jgi:hypothetical protein
MSRKRSFFRKNDEITPLSNLDIEKIAKQLKIKNFRGVFMRDTLHDRVNEKECGIVNLDSILNEGTHWVCYYKDRNKKYYFDSFGLSPPLELKKYLGKDIIMSTFQIQKLGTNYCGHLCLYILYELNQNKSFESVVLELLK